jgi:translation initiation factor 4E
MSHEVAGKQVGTEWVTKITPIYDFDTIEDFWGVVKGLKAPSELSNCTLHMFQQGILPKWEDPAHCKGGEWFIDIAIDDNSLKIINDMWLESLLVLVGGNMANADQISGVSVAVKNKKKSMRIILWMKIADETICKDTAREWVKLMRLEFGKLPAPLKFSHHEVAASSNNVYKGAENAWELI